MYSPHIIPFLFSHFFMVDTHTNITYISHIYVSSFFFIKAPPTVTIHHTHANQRAFFSLKVMLQYCFQNFELFRTHVAPYEELWSSTHILNFPPPFPTPFLVRPIREHTLKGKLIILIIDQILSNDAIQPGPSATVPADGKILRLESEFAFDRTQFKRSTLQGRCWGNASATIKFFANLGKLWFHWQISLLRLRAKALRVISMMFLLFQTQEVKASLSSLHGYCIETILARSRKSKIKLLS